MGINLMRYIDYWLGIPVCFLLSALNRLSVIVSPPYKRKAGNKKILFIKLSELGAIILAYPLLKRAKGDYPGSEAFFLTFKANKQIFEVLNGIIPEDNILTIRDKPAMGLFLDTFRVIKKIRKEKIDVVFDLEFFSRFTAIITYLAGAKKRIGFYSYKFEGLYRGNLLTHNIQYNPLLHISKSYLALWQAIKEGKKDSPDLGVPVEENDLALPRFVSTASVAQQVKGKLGGAGAERESRLFLLNPGEGILPLREWPLDNFSVLAEMILKDSRNYIILVGTASEKGGKLYKRLNNKRCINLIGKTSIPELLELCIISKALIINDCGLAHIASLTSVKEFIFFGPESPQLFCPLGKNSWIIYSNLPCSPCLSAFNHRLSVCRDNKCLTIIKPEDVYNLVMAHSLA